MSDDLTPERRKILETLARVAKEGGNVAVTRQDAEDCIELEWVKMTSTGYRLTEAGQKILSS